MKQFGNLYSQYYDLLYKDKNYNKEVEYIEKLIKKNCNNAKTVLDMGCGTGRHAELLCDKGYIVYGVDLSEDMLIIAEKRRKGKEEKLFFIHSNIQELNVRFRLVINRFNKEMRVRFLPFFERLNWR